MKKKSFSTFILFVLVFFLSSINFPATASMDTYTAYPTFLSLTLKPNVLVILDTSTSMLGFAYHHTTGQWSTDTSDPIGYYDGYFDSTKNFSYNSTQAYFYEDAAGIWSGKLLNFICMRRMDIAKKVLTGGRTGTAADGATVLKCQPYPDGCGNPGLYDQWKKFTLSGSTTYARHYRTVDAIGGYFYLCDSSGTAYGDKYYTRVKVDSTPTGIIQDMADSVRFGLEIYGNCNYHC